ncbi:auxin-responsive protein IAA32-like [Mangifera indica]|uniref:auxin-responsive protein IAA32-like n=1 Tax=Mangifera indica TaxID=29780 RepID=UPI001CFB328F|nr:auxin-responsive protein IAA32-like [Mangifera indica]
MEGYGDFMEWSQATLQLKNPGRGFPGPIQDDDDEEAEGIQSKEKWACVKVNMDGVMVGRKICILDHGGYSSLAHKLEEMFGRNSASGLRLFQAGSEFSLFYQVREANWRPVGDVTWK